MAPIWNEQMLMTGLAAARGAKKREKLDTHDYSHDKWTHSTSYSSHRCCRKHIQLQHWRQLCKWMEHHHDQRRRRGRYCSTPDQYGFIDSRLLRRLQRKRDARSERATFV